MSFKNDYKLHRKTDYESYWCNLPGYQSVNWNQLINNANKPIKVRIFNHFFTIFYYEKRGIYSSIRPSHHHHNHDISKTFNFGINLYFTFFMDNQYHDRIIRGYYCTDTHLVLCSIPDARTLVRSYENNPKETKSKLVEITNSNYTDADKLIQFAQRITKDAI